jgi:hypothetical protein
MEGIANGGRAGKKMQHNGLTKRAVIADRPKQGSRLGGGKADPNDENDALEGLTKP